ncbi:hypothetical protein [Nocardia niigatensis]
MGEGEQVGHGSGIEAIIERIAAGKGRVVGVEVAARDEVTHLVTRIEEAFRWGYDGHDGAGADVRLVLGSAGLTLERALEQIAAALQLRYGAARTLGEFCDAVGGRSAAYRECVIVADAADLLAGESEGLWRVLVQELFSGPHCMGGGWSTLVLVDDRNAWEKSVFGSAANAEHAAMLWPAPEETMAVDRELELRYMAG